jgi:hypothetical protein
MVVSEEEDLPALLSHLDAHPDDAAVRVQACVAATRRCLVERDPFWADVAETLAAEALPTRSYGATLKEQLLLARQARRQICAEPAERAGIDAPDVAADVRVA